MYPWYRDSVGGQLGQLCGPMATTIKTENGYNDCMLALDYATQSKVYTLHVIFVNLCTVVRGGIRRKFACLYKQFKISGWLTDFLPFLNVLISYVDGVCVSVLSSSVYQL